MRMNPGEKELRQHEDRWLISRLVPEETLNDDFALAEGLAQPTATAPLEDLEPFEIDTQDPGRLTALCFRGIGEQQERLPEDHVVAEVKARGMSMRDLCALSGSHNTNSFSSEFAGVITTVGVDVTSMAAGDRVFAVHGGKFGNLVRIHASLCQKVSTNDDSFADLATIPLAYGTAYHALIDTARLEAGDSVLIQTASGGVGSAAIAIARHKGAQIFVTAGTEDKRNYLHQLVIPTSHIFSSRDVRAIQDMMKMTAGVGFDVVLNTSSDDYLEKVSLPAVASFGRFVDLRTAGPPHVGHPSLSKVNPGITYTSVDLELMCKMRPQKLKRLMGCVGDLHRNGAVKPLPVKTFPISRIGDAYTEFSRFAHCGKLALLYEDHDHIPYIPPLRLAKIDAGHAYLIVGDAVDISSLAFQRLAEHGAKDFVLLHQTPMTSDAQANIDRMHETGIRVTFIQGSAYNTDHVRRAMTCSGRPIGGILYTSLDDHGMHARDHCKSQLRRLISREVHVFENLHKMSTAMSYTLHFFAIINSLSSASRFATSVSSTISCYAQGFVHRRRMQGLEATYLTIGPLYSASAPTGSDVDLQSRESDTSSVLGKHELLSLLDLALFTKRHHGPEHIILGMEPDKLAGLLDEQEGSASMVSTDDRWLIVRAHASARKKSAAHTTSDEVQGDVQDMVMDRLAKLLWVPAKNINAGTSLTSLGVDSMITSELRHWMNQAFGKTVSFMQLLSPDMTAKILAALLKGDVK